MDDNTHSAPRSQTPFGNALGRGTLFPRRGCPARPPTFPRLSPPPPRRAGATTTRGHPLHAKQSFARRGGGVRDKRRLVFWASKCVPKRSLGTRTLYCLVTRSRMNCDGCVLTVFGEETVTVAVAPLSTTCGDAAFSGFHVTRLVDISTI